MSPREHTPPEAVFFPRIANAIGALAGEELFAVHQRTLGFVGDAGSNEDRTRSMTS